jgi:uncharacterized protein YjaG (DUF416 family)
MTHHLDSWLENTAVELEGLSRGAFAAFFAYQGERLLPLYEAFQLKHGWGDFEALKQQLNNAWGMVAGDNAVAINNATVENLERLTPSGERFDSPDSTYAQDVVICIDCALRALMPHEKLSGDWLEYALEPIRTKISIEICGYASVEGEERAAWETQLMTNPEVVSFLADCEQVIATLNRPTVPGFASELRARGRSKQLQASEFIQ